MINRYRAAGPLGAWVRVIAVRTATGLIRASRADRRRTEVDAVEGLRSPRTSARKAMPRARCTVAAWRAR